MKSANGDLLGDADADLGYWLDPADTTSLTGHHQLWVWMRAAPTQRHYDPEEVECRVVTYTGFPELLTLHHPWTRAERYRFCIGGIDLNDRKHRREHFYAFGGDLTITVTTAGATLCRFVSTAPILAISEKNPLPDIFVEEVAATLAEERAAWAVQHRPGDFDALLGAASPLSLYCVCLRAAAEHLRPIRADITVPENQLVHFADRELARLAQEEACGGAPATLVELLAATHAPVMNGSAKSLPVQ